MKKSQNQEHIIQVINERKEYAGISNAELAERTGINKTRLGYVLRNQRKIQSTELVTLCVYFGISLNEIMGPKDRLILQSRIKRAPKVKERY